MNGMPIHVNPVHSDGQWTIGHDDDGLPGQWPGNMEDVCGDKDFMVMRPGMEFCDGNQSYRLDSDGTWYSA